jgi:hypothetical protein
MAAQCAHVIADSPSFDWEEAEVEELAEAMA